jgi:hypothetical protein
MHSVRYPHRLAVGFVCVALAGLTASAGQAADRGGKIAARPAVLSPTVAAAAVLPWSTPIRRAKAALGQAETFFAQHRYGKGLTALLTLRRTSGNAHRVAIAQIGKPPTDPESDDLPGPPAVLAVVNLDHRIAVRIAALFNRMRRADVVTSLRYTLALTQQRRSQMLDVVIALDPEGERADYADGMADTIPAFTGEVDAIQKGLNTYVLTASGRAGLTAALARAVATRDEVTLVFGEE